MIITINGLDFVYLKHENYTETIEYCIEDIKTNNEILLTKKEIQYENEEWLKEFFTQDVALNIQNENNYTDVSNMYILYKDNDEVKVVLLKYDLYTDTVNIIENPSYDDKYIHSTAYVYSLYQDENNETSIISDELSYIIKLLNHYLSKEEHYQEELKSFKEELKEEEDMYQFLSKMDEDKMNELKEKIESFIKDKYEHTCNLSKELENIYTKLQDYIEKNDKLISKCQELKIYFHGIEENLNVSHLNTIELYINKINNTLTENNRKHKNKYTPSNILN